MLTWMIYVVSVSAVISAAALIAEHSARQRRLSSRWLWLLAIVTSLVIPAAMTSVSIEIPAELKPSLPQNVIALHEITSTHLSPAVWIENHDGGSSTFQHVQLHAKDAWYAASTLMILVLLITASHLQWRKRQWTAASVCDVSVYLSTDVGPAVVGLLRPRIVLPVWLLDSPPEQQAAVIAHETSHIDAHDPMLLTIALCLIALMPWNLPLWWQLRRLRCAIEVDCDARVLKAGHKVAVYGETLIAVGERQSRYIGSVAGMSESRSFLERRLKLMLRKPGKRKLLVAVLLGCMSIALATLAAQVSPPIMNDAPTEYTQVPVALEILDRYVGTYKASDTSVMKVRREGDHLATQRTGQGWIEKFPMSDTEFFAKTVKVTQRFVVDDHGHVTVTTVHQDGHEQTLPRIPTVEGERIEATLATKVKSQIATPGSEAALRRNIESLQSGHPRYSEMSPGLQDAAREQLPNMTEEMKRWGPIENVRFLGVGSQGWDIYQVAHASGSAIWRIHLADNGIIDGLLVQAGP
ncbi:MULTISPECIES: M56 family metallopeptidase [Paraburkholderia]|uniref:M56 family metallopeptidase n=1 Tax=Paraburkholderia TaxID=1822464 RepID=UPI002251A6D7|nr:MULTISPECIES: M56 family metallopeptidase [Paraburkholderia]MCX4164379.1 M56 family metallopeptidase [Paraburkholderia megapolitana]MDN7159872.1 M56 family metallopeptidase [Paraburkholderia sp. CHISQ3]MDQ6496919.1 M56 family metallopeptidase [Paraburkholderia megapolitana]